MKILVTGTPGSGKTTLVEYANKNGDTRFIDADEFPLLCEWREFETGKILGTIDEVKIVGGDNWYKQHGWYWRKNILDDLLISDQDVILCGSAENIADYYDEFEMIVVLVKTEQELESNLLSPERRNPFGKTEKQRAGFMEWQDFLVRETDGKKAVFLQGNDTSETYIKIISLL